MCHQTLYRGKPVQEKNTPPAGWVIGYLAAEDHILVAQKDGSTKDVLVEKETVGLYTGKKDQSGNRIFSGDVLENQNGQKFEVRFGEFAMYCPVDDCMMENTGFFTVADGIYEDMPLGPTEEYGSLIGNIHDNPELKVDEKYRCFAELGQMEECE